MTTRTPVALDDLGRFLELGPVRLSMDGSTYAVVQTRLDLDANRYTRVIVTGQVASGSTPVELVVPEPSTSESLPCWAVDGRLATVGSGPDGWQIHVRPSSAGHPSTPVSGWPEAIEELSWSPDGAWLLFVAREPVDRAWWETPVDRRPPLHVTRLRYREDGVGWTFNRPRQAYLLAVDSGDVRKLSVGGFDDAEFGWHPDGGSVIFVSQRTADGETTLLNAIYRQSLDEGAQPTPLTSTDKSYSQPRYSPDGSRIAFTATDVAAFPAVSDLLVMSEDGEQQTSITADLDRDCNSDWHATGGPIWLDSSTVVTQVDDSGAIHAYAFSTDGGAPDRQPVGGARRATSFDAHGDAFVAVISGDAEPPKLVACLDGGQERDLWNPNAELVATRDLRRARHEPVDVPGGPRVDSWLTLPDPDRWEAPYPLVVCMQGGGTQYGHLWSHEFQSLNAAGFATLCLNPRGCAGYGNDWMRAVCGPAAQHPGTGWGVDDIGDVLAVVASALGHHDELDPMRVGVMGGSYGGLVTTWLLAKSDVFSAGWAERGPYNLFSLGGTNDESPWFFNTYLGRTLVEDPSAYWASSVLSVASGITAPVIIVHSEEDRRCPIQQAEELYMTLKLLGREVEFVRFPGESHGLTRTGSPVHRRQRLDLLHEWFTRHLRPVPASETAAVSA